MAIDEDAVDDAIEAAVDSPQRAQGDMGSVENRPLQDLIALKKLVGAESGAVNGRVFLAQYRMRPPAAV